MGKGEEVAGGGIGVVGMVGVGGMVASGEGV